MVGGETTRPEHIPASGSHLISMQYSENYREEKSDGDQNILGARRQGPLAFVHIPKCSGTAFEYYVLSQGLEFADAWPFTGLGRNGSPQTLEEYFKAESESPFVYGHFLYRDLLRCCPNAFRATFVRDPVKRTVSQYKSWHDAENFHPEDPHYIVASSDEREALLFSQHATLEEFVASDNPVIVEGALGNQQTLYLSTYLGEDMEGHLQSAKENLARFDFFGITERFAESVRLLRSMVPDFIDYEVGSERENRSRVVVDGVTDKVRGIISRQVRYDQQLYKYACELFDERVRDWASGVKPCYSRAQFLPRRNNSGDVVARLDALRKELLSRISELEREAGEFRLENAQLRTEVADLEAARSHAEEAGRQAVETQQVRVAEVEAECSRLQAHVAHLEATYLELLHVYRQIVGSRSWRLVDALQSAWMRFRPK